MPALPLAGKSAVVTGGGRGIGSAAARLLSRAGARVALVARSRREVEDGAAAIAASGGEAFAIDADASLPQSWERIGSEVMECYGRWDILINAAGITGPMAPIAQIALSDWSDTLRVNVTSALLGCQTALRAMLPAHSGIIINVASGLARRVQPGLAAYSASKAALVHFTAVLAAEVGPLGVQAFALHPGIVDTEMVRTQIAGSPDGPDAIGKRLASLALISPEQAAESFLYLASGNARGLSGTFVRFDDAAVREGAAELVRLLGLPA